MHLTTTILSHDEPVIWSMTTKTLTLDEAIKHARKALPLLSRPYLIRVNDCKGYKDIYVKHLAQ